MAKTPTEIRSLARKHTELALRTLSQICACKDAPESSRVSAATALLDRGWGKPEQSIEVRDKSIRELSDAELLAIAGSAGADQAPADPSKLN